MEIKDFLRRRLRVLGISLSELEARLNLYGHKVTKAAIGHWVTGKTKPPLKDREFVEILARALEMSAGEMLEQLGFVGSDEDWSPTVQRIASIVNHLPPDRQQLALKLIEQLEVNP